ncbi:hypothetical protein KEM56_006915 [Ascosphaera pollenicola]|nr:hypothetical protein KEM56_006915 [Ascosphaera pollenicola]
MAPEKPREAPENEKPEAAKPTVTTATAATQTDPEMIKGGKPAQAPQNPFSLPKKTPLRSLADSMKEAWLSSGNKVQPDDQSKDRIRAEFELALAKNAAANA